MTAADLNRLDELRKETNKLRSRLESLRNASEVSAVNYSCTGVGSGTGDPVAEAACSAADLDKKIRKNEFEMRMIINMIPSQKTREIFDRKYIECQSDDRIADEMGYLEKRGVTRRVERFRQAVKNGKYDPFLSVFKGVK